jgi:dipeptidyl aminopeptidase/acylaminoacyl peptidase
VSPDPLGPGGWNLWKIPIVGGTAVQLTPATGATDFYVSWSPDGQTIYFQRQEPGNDQIQAWKVPAAGGTAERVFLPSSSPDLFDAVQPGSSPDGALLVFGHGKRDGVTRNVVAHTLDPEIPSPTPAKVVANYQDTTFAAKGDFPILSPRLSPDGTRLALGSKQVWAGRRNMNLPPAFTSVTSTNEGRRSIADTAATMAFTFDPAILNTVTVLASDPEGDALSFLANFLPTWMSWNPTNRTLSGDPPIGTLGKTFYIKFWVTTPSGGTDAFVAIITVPSTLVPSAARRLAGEGSNVLGPNPTRGTFSVSTSANGGVVARLTVYDLAGRRVAAVHGPSGEALVWNGRDRKGALVPAGVYLWRLEVAERRHEGRLVVVR